MKLKKIDGKYQKPGLRPHTHVPTWLGVLLLAFPAGLLVLVSLQTNLLLSQTVPELTLARKHAIRLAVVSDIACGPTDPNFNEGNGVTNACQMRKVGDALEKEHIDALILLGDIQYPSGDFADYERSFIPFWRDIKKPIYTVAGNHDYGNGMRTPGLIDYKKAFDLYFDPVQYGGDLPYFSFNLASWRFYALDSNCEYIGGCDDSSKQYEWLKSRLATDAAVCSVGLWHHPTVTSGQYKETESAGRMVASQDALLEDGVDILLNGHEHQYERARIGDAREFIVGTGGMSLRKVTGPYALGSEKVIDTSFGYLYLELYPGRYEWQFKSVSGDILDSGADSCR